MIDTQFQDLCRGACLALGIGEVTGLGARRSVQVDNVDIALVFDEALAPDKIYCYIDLGAIDPRARGEVHARLLSLNLLTGAKTNGVFGLDTATGHAILSVHLFMPAEFGSAQLAEVLRVFARQALALRESVLDAPGSTALPGDAALLMHRV